MEYKTDKEVTYNITPGTAGIAQRIASKYGAKSEKETSKLFALMQNDVMACDQNQY